jgi:hypothetical protein
MLAIAENRSLLNRCAPGLLAVAGVAMIALATVGLRILAAILAVFGLTFGTNDGAIGAIMLSLVGGGIVVLIAALVVALTRRGRSTAKWLIGSGLALLCLGSGPLAFWIVAAKLGLIADSNPNPVFEGMLAGATFLPALILLISGLVVVVRTR